MPWWGVLIITLLAAGGMAVLGVRHVTRPPRSAECPVTVHDLAVVRKVNLGWPGPVK